MRNIVAISNGLLLMIFNIVVIINKPQNVLFSIIGLICGTIIFTIGIGILVYEKINKKEEIKW